MSQYTCFRIFNDNFIDTEKLANYSVSSEQSAFPVENIFNQKRRTKVWRSNGYFNVTNSNNKIVFQETNGVDLTAILTVDEYTSITSFSDEIERAMNSAGASTYTVTRSNLRFNITSNGTGGGGIFKLEYSDSNFTISDLIGITSDKSGALTYEMDLPRIHEEEFILWDMGVASNPDAFFYIDARNSSIKISPTATIKLQANETNNFSSPSYEQDIAYDDEVLGILSDNGIADSAYRYWRLYVVDKNNPASHIQGGAVFLGNYLNPTRGRAQFPLIQEFIDNSVTIYAESGASYSDIRQKTQSFSISIAALQKADIEDFFIFFNDFGTGKPWFISMDSDANFSSSALRKILLVKFVSEPQYRLISPDNFTLTFRIREEL